VKPKIYSKDEHQIDLNLIDSKALYILDKCRGAGYIAYLVGGGVRDLLLKKRPKDFDISTSAKPEELKALFSNAILIGKRFRLAHIRFGRKVFEVSTFRAGDIENEQLITEDNIWGNPEQDVLRRDFTINGLFYDSEKEEVIDYVGGYPDAQKKYLRAIGQPFMRFKQDPVRMIRCLKFQARFGFEVDEEARQALIDCRKEILKSSQARVLEELLRMLESGSASPFFKLMTDHGLLQQLIPELAEFLEKPEGGEIYDYLKEADTAIKEPYQLELQRPVLLACLIFPILQKHLQTHFVDREKIPHLGEIYQEVNDLMDSIFTTFFTLTRKLRITTINLLVSQYRITPFSKEKRRQIRIPRIVDFDLALQFLSVRARIEPALQETAKKWFDAFQKFSETDSLPRPERTRGRRPRRRS